MLRSFPFKPTNISNLISNCMQGIKYYVTRNSRPPTHITFMVTRRCNSNCVMCSVPKTAGYELSISEIRDIFSDTFFHSLKSICLSGGEPFVRKDLFEIVRTVLEVQPKLSSLSILTNGLAPSPIEKDIREIISICRKHTPINLCISISLLGTNNETYQNITKVPNGYTRVTDTIHRIKMLQNIFPLDIRLNTTLQPMNVTELPYLLRLAQQLKLPIRFTPVHINDSFFNNLENKDKLIFQKNDIIFLKNFFSQPREGINELSRAYWNDYFRVVNGKKRKTPCVLPFDVLVIDADGECFVCVAPFTYGNVRREKVSTIWNSKKTRYARKRIIKEYCPSCSAPCAAEDSIKQEFFFFFRFLLKEFFKKEGLLENSYNL